MTQNQRVKICDSLGDLHFGDGPPHWVLSAGKPWERPSETLGEAKVRRDQMSRKLRWHGKANDERGWTNLARTLDACRDANRCFSGACPICVRATQRWFVSRGLALHVQRQRKVRQRFTILSAVPDFGRVPQTDLLDFDWREFGIRLRRAFRRAGVERFMVGIDVSLNHWEGDGDSGAFQFQLWGPITEPRGEWIDQLKFEINRSNSVVRPIMRFSPLRPRASLAYGVKDTFKRRVSYMDHRHREGRGPCHNTRERPLKGEAWARLMIYLDRIGLEGRVIESGV
jgi:hypothetical protein